MKYLVALLWVVLIGLATWLAVTYVPMPYALQVITVIAGGLFMIVIIIHTLGIKLPDAP